MSNCGSQNARAADWPEHVPTGCGHSKHAIQYKGDRCIRNEDGSVSKYMTNQAGACYVCPVCDSVAVKP